jgi:hypothetical protein
VAEELVAALLTREHPRGAAVWAIHRLVEQNFLDAEIATVIEHPIIDYRQDPNSTVVQAPGLFGSRADHPRYQVPIYGSPIKKLKAAPGQPVPYDCLLVRSTPALWEWSRRNPVLPSLFEASDFERAVSALDESLQEFHWKPGENHILLNWLTTTVCSKKISFALAVEILRRLCAREVFILRSHTAPAGTSYEKDCPLPIFRSEPETTLYLTTTQEKWYTYLAEHKRARAAQVVAVQPMEARSTAQGARKGRPKDTDARQDRRVFDAWQTRAYRTYAELAREMHLTPKEVERALDRERKRRQGAA